MNNYHTINTQSDYVNVIVELISSCEGHIAGVRNISDGKATIGYGYTFNRSDNLALWTAAGITLTEAERTILRNIDNAANNNKTNLALAHFTRNITANEAHDLLRQTYRQYEGPANELEMPISYERAAFVSITYSRGVAAVRTRMQAFYEAVQADNRAESWFQIRYNSQTSNPSYVNGIAKRRFYEADVFGLYENHNGQPPTEAESVQVYQMYTAHRNRILTYEETYGYINGRNGSRGNWVAVANRDFNAEVGTLQEELQPAANVLLGIHIRDEYRNISGFDLAFNPLNIQVASDQIFQLQGENTAERTGSNNDMLIGRDGDGGNDVLRGGESEIYNHVADYTFYKAA